MTTPAEELRAAAEKLRRLAGQADDGPWQTTWRGQEYHLDGYRDGELHPVSEWTYAIATGEPQATEQRADCDTANADFIAAMHPGAGQALAELLAFEAGLLRISGAEMRQRSQHLLALARLINGSPS
ncbi:hypothetical protein [Streptomyces formicae]|uniref:Uncharacterized protein n=1 Tax=Streptomyces formicae TaxID=1616117 RepID=A0ABY3WMG1_9ACTN|nr:hypothetical protein [Streptomyces formicae]UNM13804.1 hypothetical protein J4032_22180 [Streptomyces formicae]